jgi:hypothetical protein
MRHKRGKDRGGAVWWAFVLLFVVMAFTGFGQMPIFKRYYIADIPGMGWSADYYLTHTLHYLGAILLLALFSYSAAYYLLSGVVRSYKLSTAGIIRVLLLAGLTATGVVRVLKNLQGVSFSPTFTMVVDISHLGFMMAYLAAAVLFLVLKQGWVTERRTPGG